MSTFYVSTPIYYVNGEPHVGHAYTTIIADALARHYRQRGFDTFFLTGTDEHGLKVQREAESRGISAKELADQNSGKFKELFEKLELTHDRFVRTTDADHKMVVERVVEAMKKSGDIYLDTYAGWYAAADEAFYDESEIEDGHSVSTGAQVEWVEESSYFFRLSKYEKPLLDWYAEDENHVQPDARRNEVSSFVSGGLRDLSISRTTFEWGIEFPGDPDHVLYVWVDALTNYITGVGAFSDDEKFNKYWPCDCHLIGKDILRFHAVYWPAFLMSAGIPLPKQVFAHGWWMVEGNKMGKRAGNFLDAFELADRYPLDLLRYYLLREMPLGGDGNFVQARVIGRNNSELADNLGNLVNRSFAMSTKFLETKVPAYVGTSDELDVDLVNKATEARDALIASMEKRETHRAMETVMGFSSELNLYVANTQPWSLNKRGETERLNAVMYHLLEGVRWVAVLASAFIPHAASKVLAGLGLSGDESLLYSTLEWGGLAAETELVTPDVLFPKIDLPKEIPVQEEKKVENKSADAEGTGIVTFDDFLKVELKVGHIVAGEKVEGADKLLKLTVDAGEAEPRTIVAGIAKSYDAEDLIGKRVAMVANLKPRKVFKILSQGMLLAVDTEDGGLELAQYSEAVKPGTRIS